MCRSRTQRRETDLLCGAGSHDARLCSTVFERADMLSGGSDEKMQKNGREGPPFGVISGAEMF